MHNFASLRPWLLLTTLAATLAPAHAAESVTRHDATRAGQSALAAYRTELDAFRQEFGGARELPEGRNDETISTRRSSYRLRLRRA